MSVISCKKKFRILQIIEITERFLITGYEVEKYKYFVQLCWKMVAKKKQNRSVIDFNNFMNYKL